MGGHGFPKSTVDLSTQEKIDILFTNFCGFLKEKNRRYGDAAISPLRIFSEDDSGDQIRSRIDDKLSRIKKSVEAGEKPKKNDVSDLFGYTALYMIEELWLEFDEFLD